MARREIQTYIVEVVETLRRKCTVAAETEGEAIEIIQKEYYEEESIVLDYSDHDETEFNIV